MKSALPSSDADIKDIWEYAKTLDIKPNGGFDDWMTWMQWTALRYKAYKDSGILPDSDIDLERCLQGCYERDLAAAEFGDGDERQKFPRDIIKKLAII